MKNYSKCIMKERKKLYFLCSYVMYIFHIYIIYIYINYRYRYMYTYIKSNVNCEFISNPMPYIKFPHFFLQFFINMYNIMIIIVIADRQSCINLYLYAAKIYFSNKHFKIFCRIIIRNNFTIIRI